MKIKSIQYPFFGDEKKPRQKISSDIETKRISTVMRESVVQRLFEGLLCSEYEDCVFVRKTFVETFFGSGNNIDINKARFCREKWLDNYEDRPDFVFKNGDGVIIVAIELKWDDDDVKRIEKQISNYLSHGEIKKVFLITRIDKMTRRYHEDDLRYVHLCYDDIMPWIKDVIARLNDHQLNMFEDESERNTLLAYAYSLLSLIHPLMSEETRKEKMSRVMKSAFELVRQEIPEILKNHPDWKPMVVPKNKDELDVFCGMADVVYLPIIHKGLFPAIFLFGFINDRSSHTLMIALKVVKTDNSFAVVSKKELNNLRKRINDESLPWLNECEKGFLIKRPACEGMAFSLFGNRKLEDIIWFNMTIATLSQKLIESYVKCLDSIDKVLAKLENSQSNLGIK